MDDAQVIHSLLWNSVALCIRVLLGYFVHTCCGTFILSLGSAERQQIFRADPKQVQFQNA